MTDPQSPKLNIPDSSFLWNLLNSMLDPILVKDRQHRWIFLNEAFCTFTGYQREELLGKSDYDFFPTEEADIYWEKDELVFMTGLANENEELITTAQGETFVISTQKTLLKQSENELYLIVSIRRIASRGKIESELIASRRFLQDIIDNIPQAIFWKDQNSVYLGCNQYFANFVDLDSPQMIVGKTDHDLFWSAEETEKNHASDRRVIESQIPEYKVLETQIRDGNQTIWIETNKVPLYDDPGNIIGILGTYEDVTERKQAEESLRQSEATNRALIEAIPDLLIRMHRDGTYLDLVFKGDFKPFAVDTNGGKNIVDVMPDSIAQQRLNHIQEALETKELQLYEQELMINGQLLYEEVRIVPSGPDEVITMIRDITDRKRAEIAIQKLNEELEEKVEKRTQQFIEAISQLEQEIRDRKRAKAQLQEKEEFLRNIFEGIEHQIFVINVVDGAEFRYGGWNRYTEEQLNISSAEAVGKTPEDIFGAEEGQEVRQRYLRCLQTGTTVSYEECLTFQGESNWFITTLNPLRNIEGQIYCLVGMTFNITDRKLAETALQESETQLRIQTQELEQTLQELQRTQVQLIQSEKMSSLGQLVAGVAHEINNPVNFIYGNLKHAENYTMDLLQLLHLYQESYPTPVEAIQAEAEEIDLEFLVADLPKLLNSMRVGADRIQKIVASLRTFSRMDEAEMKAVNLPDCVDSTLMILQSRLKERPDRSEIKVIQEYGKLPLVECYAGQLNQVFMNILSNAIDALEEAIAMQKNDQPCIIVKTELNPDHQVVIQISDNGLGIPEDKKSRIFDPFFTTKPIGKGTGMGLSISYQIVTEKHGGRLWFESAPGAGTTFVIEIPSHQRQLPLRK